MDISKAIKPAAGCLLGDGRTSARGGQEKNWTKHQVRNNTHLANIFPGGVFPKSYLPSLYDRESTPRGPVVQGQPRNSGTNERYESGRRAVLFFGERTTVKKFRPRSLKRKGGKKEGHKLRMLFHCRFFILFFSGSTFLYICRLLCLSSRHTLLTVRGKKQWGPRKRPSQKKICRNKHKNSPKIMTTVFYNETEGSMIYDRLPRIISIGFLFLSMHSPRVGLFANPCFFAASLFGCWSLDGKTDCSSAAEFGSFSSEFPPFHVSFLAL